MIKISVSPAGTTSFYNPGTDTGADKGYVQGMSDLCAPLYVVMDAEEELTFWCFVEVMNRMVCYRAAE